MQLFDKVVDVPVSMQRQAPTTLIVCENLGFPQIEFIDRVVDTVTDLTSAHSAVIQKKKHVTHLPTHAHVSRSFVVVHTTRITRLPAVASNMNQFAELTQHGKQDRNSGPMASFEHRE